MGGLIANGTDILLFVTRSGSALETTMGAKDQGLELTSYLLL
jgi:hypothetical protein